MPRSITPVSVRMTNGTSLPFTFVVAMSAGRALASASGLIDPSFARYDHDVFVGASQSASVALPRPAASVVHTHGSMCGPANIGPFFEWLTTVSPARVSPTCASSALSPSRMPVTTPWSVPFVRLNASVTLSPLRVTCTSPLAAGPDTVTSTSPPLTNFARADAVSIVSASLLEDARVVVPSSWAVVRAPLPDVPFEPVESFDESHAAVTQHNATNSVAARTAARFLKYGTSAPGRCSNGARAHAAPRPEQ